MSLKYRTLNSASHDESQLVQLNVITNANFGGILAIIQDTKAYNKQHWRVWLKESVFKIMTPSMHYIDDNILEWAGVGIMKYKKAAQDRIHSLESHCSQHQ